MQHTEEIYNDQSFSLTPDGFTRLVRCTYTPDAGSLRRKKRLSMRRSRHFSPIEAPCDYPFGSGANPEVSLNAHKSCWDGVYGARAESPAGRGCARNGDSPPERC